MTDSEDKALLVLKLKHICEAQLKTIFKIRNILGPSKIYNFFDGNKRNKRYLEIISYQYHTV